MFILHTDISKILGYDYKNESKPFYLQKSVKFAVSYKGEIKRHEIEQGFTSDGCTIPKIFWVLIGCPHTPKYIPASLIHDWILDNPEAVDYDRKYADLVFKTELLNCGVKPSKAQRMYLAVELWQSVSNLWRHKWR